MEGIESEEISICCVKNRADKVVVEHCSVKMRRQ